VQNLKFYINNVQVTPRNQRELKLKKSVAGDYYKQVSLNGDIILDNQNDAKDFTYFKTLEATPFETYSIKIVSDRGEEYNGEFMIMDCKVDPYVEKVTIKPILRDLMTYVKEAENVEVDVLKGVIPFTYVKGEVYTWLSFTQAIFNPFSHVQGITYINTDVYSDVYYDMYDPVLSGMYEANVGVWVSECVYASIDVTMDDTWTLITKGDLVSLYQRKVSAIEEALTNEYNLPDADGNTRKWNDWLVSEDNLISFRNFYDYHYVAQGMSSYFYWTKKVNFPDINDYKDSDVWVVLQEGELQWMGSVKDRDDNTLTNMPYFVAIKKSIYNNKYITKFEHRYRCQKLSTMLNNILTSSVKAIKPEFTGNVVSTFLFDETNPDPEPGLFYKSIGLSLPAGSDTTKMYICEMSDFIKPEASEAASEKKITLKKILDGLLPRFKCGIYINSNGDLAIEHVSFFRQITQVYDATVHGLRGDYYFLTGAIPNREYYEEQKAYNEDYTKKTFLYGKVPTLDGLSENAPSYSISNIFTDVDGINQHLQDVGTDGFVLMRAYKSGTQWTLRKTVGFVSGESTQNGFLSLGNLLYVYHTFDCFKPIFTIDGKEVTAKTLKRLKKEKITIMAEDIPEGGILTGNGVGEVESIEWNISEDEVNHTIELAHD
jgi:hypothetical protein